MSFLSKNLVEKVTKNILSNLEKGDLPPWSPGHPFTRSSLPYNYKSGRFYKGSNIFFLIMSGFACPAWNTYKAWNAAGFHVNKGEKGTPVVGWARIKKTVEKEVERPDGKIDVEEVEKTMWKPFGHIVFNAVQTSMSDEDLAKIHSESLEMHDHEKIDSAEEIFEKYHETSGVTLNHRNTTPCYRHTPDTIEMPDIKYFSTTDIYYSTLFHEMVHSTGHSKRLNRKNASETEHKYDFEELVAEMGAALLCAYTDTANDREIENMSAYLKGWLKAFQNNPEMIVSAGTIAQKAVEYILK